MYMCIYIYVYMYVYVRTASWAQEDLCIEDGGGAIICMEAVYH